MLTADDRPNSASQSAPHVGHHHHTLGEQPAVRGRDRERHDQAFTVEVLEEPGLPREIGIAPRAETADREVPVEAHAPYVVGDSASERFDASGVFTPPAECLPPHWITGHCIEDNEEP